MTTTRTDLLGTDGLPCEGCEGSSGLPPVTSKGFCRDCALRACADGYGDLVGLPSVPADSVDAAETALDAHMAACEIEDREDSCPVCAFGSIHCSECQEASDEFSDEENFPHRTVEEWVTVGCEGYHHPVLRAAWAARS